MTNEIDRTKITVLVDDNFHYMDADERYAFGSYDTMEEAVTACKKIVDTFLAETYKPGMTEAELTQQYFFFGEDPWISDPSDHSLGVPFSAWKYASQRIEEIFLDMKPLTDKKQNNDIH